MKMKAAQIGKAGGDWELGEREIPELGAGQVRVKVEVCGICHSDLQENCDFLKCPLPNS